MKSKAPYRERTFEFTLGLFPYTVRVIVSNDLNVARKKREEWLKWGDLSHLDDVHAYHISKGDGVSYLFLPFNISAGDTAHECSHVLWRLMEYVGMKPENETQAYCLGHLVSKVYGFSLTASQQYNKRKATQN